jgi:hypothetical protein
MLDFDRVQRKEITIARLAEGLTPADLSRLTNEMIDRQLSLIAACADADVTFEPSDPAAFDDAAVTEAEVRLPWTLGHIVVHVTASGEESAALASELARGVAFHGRSRSEVPWQTMTAIAQCRERLEESRRMRLASLDIWPAQPYLENTYQPYEGVEPVNAINRFIRGLSHDHSHLGHLADVVRQAQQARLGATIGN